MSSNTGTSDNGLSSHLRQLQKNYREYKLENIRLWLKYGAIWLLFIDCYKQYRSIDTKD